VTRVPKTRTQRCSKEQARKRLQDAWKFLEVADLVDDEPLQTSFGVSASLAVLAGIAAADAACCSALGLRSRGQDHNDAADLLEGVAGSADAVRALRRLLGLKNDAQYGLISVTATKRSDALRQAGKVVAFAEAVVAR
jgi:hypothetical protein